MKCLYHLSKMKVDYQSRKNEESSNPKAKGEKLKCSIIQYLIKDQFPKQVQEKEDFGHHAIQITKFKNKKCLQRW